LKVTLHWIKNSNINAQQRGVSQGVNEPLRAGFQVPDVMQRCRVWGSDSKLLGKSGPVEQKNQAALNRFSSIFAGWKSVEKH
jgi:hypothetical protein